MEVGFLTHKLKITLVPIHDSTPCHVCLKVNDKTINQEMQTKQEFVFDYAHSDWLEIEIHKTGKTKDLVDKKHKQELLVENVSLNGFNCFPNLFGQFAVKDNSYLNESLLQTSHLTLNGIWSLKLPLWHLNGINGFDLKNKMRDIPNDCDVATFGCSFTYGNHIDSQATWPAQLSKLSGRKILNFGVGGSNNTEITENALYFTKKYQAHDVVLLLCHFSRLQIKDGANFLSAHVNMTEPQTAYVKNEMQKIVKYGETELLFASQSKYFLEKIKEIKKNIKGKIYISTYIKDHYECLLQIKNDDFVILPFFDMDVSKKMAKDGRHPSEEHYRHFAKNIVQYVNGKN